MQRLRREEEDRRGPSSSLCEVKRSVVRSNSSMENGRNHLFITFIRYDTLEKCILIGHRARARLSVRRVPVLDPDVVKDRHQPGSFVGFLRQLRAERLPALIGLNRRLCVIDCLQAIDNAVVVRSGVVASARDRRRALQTRFEQLPMSSVHLLPDRFASFGEDRARLARQI